MKRIITLVLTLAALLVLTVTACADTIPGTAKLTITPTDTKVSGDTATVTYSVTVTPPEGKELGVFSVQLQPSDGMTLPRKFTVDGKKVITYGDGKLEYDEVEKTGYFATYEYTPQTGYFHRYGGTPIASIRNNTYTFLAAGTSETAHSYTDEKGNTIEMPKHIWDTNLVKTKIVTLKVLMNDGAANCSLTVDTAVGSSGRFTVGKSVQDPTTGKYSVQEAFTGVATSNKYGADDVLWGDVDGSSEVDNIDAAMIYSYFNGFIEFTDEQLRAADVDGSGEVDNIDAAMVYSYFNGYLDTFPVAE